MLETERLTLRPWKEEDAAELYELAKDPLVGPACGWAPHTDVENSRQIIRDILAVEGTYALVSKENGRILGCVSLMREEGSIELGPDEAEIGYWIGHPYWGRELAPEVVEEFLRYGFEELGLKRIWCMYFEGNEKSRRVQEKCGFHFQYCLENVEIHALGITVREFVNLLTREEWEQRKKKGREAQCL